MSEQPWAAPPPLSEAGHVVDDEETIIFVDVDGVLNVGIADPGHHPMELSAENAKIARDNWGARGCLERSFQKSMERLEAARKRQTEGEGSDALSEHTSCNGNGLSELLVWRLAQIIRAAGSKALVVLSSSWRSDLRRVVVLEKALGRHLGRAFSFGASTDQCEETGAPQVRLRSIARFLERHCAASGRRAAAGRLRVLVLDDFHIKPFGWSYEGAQIDTPEAVERLVQSSCAPAGVEASVRLLHPYDEWVTPQGLIMQVGTGITGAHLGRALRFLGAGDAPPEPAGLRPGPPRRAPRTTAVRHGALARALVYPGRFFLPDARPLLWLFAEALQVAGAAGKDPGQVSGKQEGLVLARGLIWPL